MIFPSDKEEVESTRGWYQSFLRCLTFGLGVILGLILGILILGFAISIPSIGEFVCKMLPR